MSLSNKINSPVHEGPFCFSKDGKTLYLTKNENDITKNIIDAKERKVKLYVSRKDSIGDWSKPVVLPFCSEKPIMNILR